MSNVRTYRTRKQVYGRVGATDPETTFDNSARSQAFEPNPWRSSRVVDALSSHPQIDPDDGAWIAPTTVAVFLS